MELVEYITKIRRNQSGNNDVVESSCGIKNIFLSDKQCDALRVALDPFVAGKADHSDLIKVFRNPNIFPKSILRDLEALREERDLRTVFVIHNTPVTSETDFPEESETGRLKSWLARHSYAACIIEGIFQSLDKKLDSGIILRQPNGYVQGGKLHKDNRPFAALSAVRSDGANTRMTDFASVLMEAQADSFLSDLSLDIGKRRTTIADFDKTFSDWENQEEGIRIEISPEQPVEKEEAFERLIARHSVNLQLVPGDIAFWGNKGRIFHQALPTTNIEVHADKTYSRIAIAASPPRVR